MTAPSFSYSGNVYTSAAAGSVDFALTSTTGNPIAYLEKAHIHVYKSTNQGSTWTELTRPSQWDFVSGGTVARLVTGIATGDWIKVQRITPSTAAYVTFQSSSLLTADQLNDDTLFNTYLNQERYDQGDQSSAVAAAASASAASATSAATAATTTANAASAAAAAATTTANAASASAATALSQSNTAITDSAAALAASANAVTTANTAATNAASAVTTAGTANTNATAAVNTANTAASNASTALSQSTTALSNSATALSTANTANTNASTALTNSSNAVTTANTASTNASNAVTTANTANTNATAALNAVASSLQYVLVANVAAIPSSPANNYAIEVADSTGVESFSPLANRPAGFVGDVGLSVRMQYSTTGPTWNWLNYFPNNAETRYLKLAGGTLTGQLRADDSTSVAAPVIAFDGDTNTGLAHTGADELALVTGGTARLTVDPSGAVAVTNALSVGGQAAVVTNDARLSDTRTPTDGSVTNAKVSASAAIAGSKISPDFGAQNVTTTGTSTAASFIPTSSTVPTNGLYLPSAGSVAISTGGSGRLFIDASGNVGVGTGSPTQLLHVNNASGAARCLIQASGTSNAELRLQQSTGTVQIGTNATNFYFYDPAARDIDISTNGVERLRITSTGRVGVGTSSPGSLLHTSIASDNELQIQSTGSGGSGNTRLRLRSATSTTTYDYFLQGDASGDFRLYDAKNATDRLRVTSTGLVGIGTSAPGATLDVAPDANRNLQVQGKSGTTYGLEIKNGTANSAGEFHVTAASSGAVVVNRGTTEIARFNSTGLGIGTSTITGFSDYTTVQLGSSSSGSALRLVASGDTPGTDDFVIYKNTSGSYLRSYGDPIVFFGNSSEYGRWDTSGRLLVGTSSSSANTRAVIAGRSDGNPAGTLMMEGTSTTPANGDVFGQIRFSAAAPSGSNSGVEIAASRDGGTWTNNSSMPSRLSFATTADGASSPTERMRIDNAGKVFIGKTSRNFDATGVEIVPTGGSHWVANATTCLSFNRLTNDGDLIEFGQGGFIEGTISVSGSTVSYNGAHLSRWSQLPGGVERTEILRGTVLSNIDEMCEWGDEDNEQLNRMKVSDVEGDKNVAGVFQAWDDDDDTYTNDFYCAMTGDFIIRIGAGVTVERGDLLMSAGDGTAKPQDDDIIRSKTIAKVTSTNVSCTYDDGSYCVPCVLMAC